VKLISRNALTNIVGAALTAWMGDQAIAGKLTWDKVWYATPLAIVNFAAGAKDSKLAELERRLNLSPSDRAAAKTIGGIVLNQIANRFGYRRISNDLATFDSLDRSNVLGAGTVAGVRDQYADRGDGLNADTLDRMAASSDYSDRRAVPAPAARVARYWEERPPELPVVGSPTIDGTNISGVEFAVRSASGSDGPDGPRSEAW
jgi:hypothetical protein